MKIHEIITERSSQQKVVTMYHGTSSVFLPSIQKFGLDPNPKPIRKPGDPHPSQIRKLGLDPIPAQKTWYPDGKEALLSYGGVYITTSNDVATTAAQAAAKRHGGEPILITVQYVLGSGGLDEDIVHPLIIKSFFYSLEVNEFVNDFTAWLQQLYNIKYPQGNRQDLINMYNFMYSKFKQWIKDDPNPQGPRPRIYPTTYQEIEDIAQYMLNKGAYALYLEDNTYRNQIKKIMEIIKVSKDNRKTSHDYINVRITRPITFRGKTRIVDISKI